MTFNRLRSKHKYGAKKQSLDGYSFASGLERGLYLMLKAREQSGEIRNIKVQDRVFLSDAKIEYRPDFRFEDCATGEIRWAESKGMETSDWRIKRRLWMSYGPGVLEIWKGSGLRIFLHETLKGKKK